MVPLFLSKKTIWYRLALALCLFSVLFYAVAGDLVVDGKIIKLVRQKYGGSAVHRVMDWKDIMGDYRGKSEREKLNYVNRFFNRLRWKSDMEVWGVKDYWATPIETLGVNAGDCDDYSIAKYVTLKAMGVPDSKLRVMYVKAKRQGVAHMVVAYYKNPRAVPLILDNINKRVLSAKRRRDLKPVYSLNGEGLWLAKSRGQGRRVSSSKRMGLWNDMNARMKRQLRGTT